MSNEDKEKKDLMEAIINVAQTVEELKAVLAPIIPDQKIIHETLEEHGKAIKSLWDRLIGTKEEHEKRLKSLEFVRIELIDNKLERHDSIIDQIEKRIKRIEYEPIREVLNNLKQKKITVSDLQIVEKILAIHSDDLYLMKLKIEILDMLGEWKGALNYLEKILQKNPEDAFLWHKRGVFLEDFDERLKSFDESIKLVKAGFEYNLHLVYYSRATLLSQAKKFEDALESATKSVEAAPECSNAWTQKGKILIQLSNFLEAMGCFQKAIELNKNNYEAWFAKGIALSAIGKDQNEQALVSFDNAISLNPDFSPSYFNKGVLLNQMDQDERALEAFNKGLEIDEKYVCGWCQRGIALLNLGRNEESLESLNKATEINQNIECGDFFGQKASALNNLGFTKDAITLLDRIIKSKIGLNLSASFFNTYAWILYESGGRYEEGINLAEKAIKEEPDNACYWDTLACNYQALHNDQKAIEAFQEAVSLKKSDKEISWKVLAEVYERLGRDAEAKHAYKKHECTKNA
jgi:tetratricopeptide (TPR) repeat protein